MGCPLRHWRVTCEGPSSRAPPAPREVSIYGLWTQRAHCGNFWAHPRARSPPLPAEVSVRNVLDTTPGVPYGSARQCAAVRRASDAASVSGGMVSPYVDGIWRDGEPLCRMAPRSSRHGASPALRACTTARVQFEMARPSRPLAAPIPIKRQPASRC
jgi:hypothetical protein